MMKTSKLSVLIMLGLAALSCSDYGTNGPFSTPHPMPPLTPAQKVVVSSGNSFGLKLFKAMNASEVGENLLISPLSVSMALGMTLNGANGSTKEAMEQTLGFTGLTREEINSSYATVMNALTNLDPRVQMEIGNSIWYRPILNVEQAFKEVNATYFGAQITSLDFGDPAAASIINGWVSDKTHGKIPTIVDDPVSSDIVMYLINAVYFKGTWTHRFDSTATYDAQFKTSGGLTVPCRMMTMTDTLAFMRENGLVGVDLPYGSGGFSMTIFLPPDGTSIDDFIAGVTPEQWDNWTNRLAFTELQIRMPKFKLSYDTMLNRPLESLGMGIAFSDLADFTGIDKRGQLAISEVKHKTFIQVDEEGTEAAAVTSVGMRATSAGGGPPVILLDRPFLYVIREHASGAIMFVGKLAQPKW